MHLTGITDEAGPDISTQIRVAKELGWSAVELRNAGDGAESGPVHEIPEPVFEKVAAALDEAGVGVAAIGSAVANWARSIDEPFDVTEDQLTRVIPRAQRLGCRHIRIMSYAVRKNEDGSDAADQMEEERFRRLREIVRRLDDAGLTAVHENCMNYGGMGISFTRRLLAEVPGLRLVFDTGNPVFNRDRDADTPAMQDPWAFWTAVRDHVDHVHVKDCLWNPAKEDADYTWPGEGDGRVRDIIADLKTRGYGGWISIEPHLAVVYHSTDDEDAAPAADPYSVFADYGRRMATLVAEA